MQFRLQSYSVSYPHEHGWAYETLGLNEPRNFRSCARRTWERSTLQAATIQQTQSTRAITAIFSFGGFHEHNSSIIVQLGTRFLRQDHFVGHIQRRIRRLFPTLRLETFLVHF
jgi:hypothetical protein